MVFVVVCALDVMYLTFHLSYWPSQGQLKAMHSSGQLQHYVDVVVNTSVPMNVVSVVSEQGKQSLHLQLTAANQSNQHMAALIQCKAKTR